MADLTDQEKAARRRVIAAAAAQEVSKPLSEYTPDERHDRTMELIDRLPDGLLKTTYSKLMRTGPEHLLAASGKLVNLFDPAFLDEQGRFTDKCHDALDGLGLTPMSVDTWYKAVKTHALATGQAVLAYAKQYRVEDRHSYDNSPREIAQNLSPKIRQEFIDAVALELGHDNRKARTLLQELIDIYAQGPAEDNEAADYGVDRKFGEEHAESEPVIQRRQRLNYINNVLWGDNKPEEYQEHPVTEMLRECLKHLDKPFRVAIPPRPQEEEPDLVVTNVAPLVDPAREAAKQRAADDAKDAMFPGWREEEARRRTDGAGKDTEVE